VHTRDQHAATHPTDCPPVALPPTSKSPHDDDFDDRAPGYLRLRSTAGDREKSVIHAATPLGLHRVSRSYERRPEPQGDCNVE